MHFTKKATRDALRNIDCLVDDERLNGTTFARLLAAELEAQHVAENLDDVNIVQITVGQLIGEVAGVTDEELIDAARPLLAAGADGKVQKSLTNGHILVAKRAQVDVAMNGEHRKVSVGTRFLSADPEVLEKYALAPIQHKAENLARRSAAHLEQIGDRQPAMAERTATFLDELKVTFTMELGGGE